ncbi:MAG: DUF962 domain-containing protein [Acidobacteria bacterium]|nr:DUF962 domain-containing protein [Acidobacteriota bacterium]
MRSFQEHMELYRAEHRTVGCKISHLIGVPMIVASFPMLIFNWRWAIALFVVGWMFQLAGHKYFEKNRPVLAADPANPWTYFAAIIFVAQEWGSLLSGRGLGDSEQLKHRS